jgi:hypothetical protein
VGRRPAITLTCLILIYIIFWSEGGLKGQALPSTGQIRMMTEGSVIYKLSSPQLPPAEAAIVDSVTYTLSIKGSRIRTDFVGGLGTTTTIYSSLSHAGALLREYGQQKLLVRMTKEDFEDLGKTYRFAGYNLTGDTAMIAGYLCKKAWSTTEAGDTLVVWYAPDLLPQNKEYSYRFTPLPGLPLQYESMMGKWKVTYKAAKVSMEPVPSSRFDIPKVGYREMTYKESKDLLSH